MADRNACLHSPRQGNIFSKATFKQMGLRLDPRPRLCPLCLSYGVRWKLLAEFPGRLVAKQDAPDPDQWANAIDREAFDKGRNLEILWDDSAQRLSEFGITEAQFNPFVFSVEGGQNGETYHAIICALLTKNNKSVEKISIKSPGGPEDKTMSLRELCSYYVKNSMTDDNKPGHSKAEATECIAKAFKYLQDIGNKQQAQVFAALRASLDDVWLVGKVPVEYACPSYAGKYWINRYLTLTNQPSRKLPKALNVKVAVIMVRRNPKADDSRLMTQANILECLEAICLANQVAVRCGELPFTHVLLLNDVNLDELDVFRRLCARRLEVPPMQLLYISSPFQKRGVRIDDFWNSFKEEPESPFNSEIECLPVEAKVFSFFLALQKRYVDQLCYIGFRSGTLDGPSFIGSPIFSLDDTNLKNVSDENDKGFDKFRDMAYLYDADSEAVGGTKFKERMDHTAQALNSYVRIEVLQKKKDERVEDDIKEVIQLDGTARTHLAAALYLYMITLNGERAPFWTNRIPMMKNVDDGRRKLRTRLNQFLQAMPERN